MGLVGGSVEFTLDSTTATTGTAMTVQRAKGGKVKLIDSFGLDLTDQVQAGASKALLVAVLRLVSQDNLLAFGHITSATESAAVVRLRLTFQLRLWEGLQQWKRGAAASLVFRHLQVTSGETGKDADTHNAEERFSLASCFEQLNPPPSDAELPLLPLSPECSPSTHLSVLNVEDLEKVMSHLSLIDLAALASTNRFFRALATRMIPGLQLSLYAHQRAAVQWMLKRERAKGPVPSSWQSMTTEEGVPFWVCAETGDFSAEPPVQPQDFKGGFLCDEPGLGKTITGLALVLRTLRTLPEPPPTATVTSVPQPAASQRGLISRASYYTLPDNIPAKTATPASSQRANRRSSGVSSLAASSQCAGSGRGKSPSQAAAHLQRAGTDRAAKKPRLLREMEMHHPTQTRGSAGVDSPLTAADEAAHAQDVVQQLSEAVPAAQAASDLCHDGSMPQTDHTHQGRVELHPADWVACDICHKWRKLPEGSLVGEFWVCRMHPDPGRQSCNLPEDVEEYSQQYVQSPGFVLEGSAPGSAAGVAHFAQVLGSLPDEFSGKQAIAQWIAKQAPDQLAMHSFKVPAAFRHPEGYQQLLLGLGFQLVEIGKDKTKRVKQVAIGKASKSAQWMQPWHLARLRLDCLALQRALESGRSGPSQRIYLSPATLLVLPATLVQHWIDQVEQHTRHGLLRVAVLLSEGSRSSPVANVSHLAWDYDLVITSISRLSSEWTHARSSSPLLQVHWLRVMLDEGHMLGASLSITNKLQMACALRAERRWVMTGTPTPNTPSAHLAHLQPLLAFLGQEPYGLQRRVWEDLVQRPFEANQPQGKARLMELLERTMTRAAKSTLQTLPRLTRTVTRLKFAPDHARSYNELVEVIERNLLLADWQDEDHNESLLSHSQSKWAREMLNNVRMSCCVAGNCNLSVKEEDVQEMLQLVEARLWPPQQGSSLSSQPQILASSSSPQQAGPPWVAPDHPLAPIERGVRDGCNCWACGSTCRLPIATPCGHLLCLPCTSRDRLRCSMPGCGKLYVMQSIDDPGRNTHNSNPKWEVPWELIEWQASYTQVGAIGIQGGHWSANWQITKSSKCVHLLKRLLSIGAARAPWQSHHPVAGSTAPSTSGTLTKAIIFSQFWMHIQLVVAHLRSHGVTVSVLKRGLSPRAKAEALDVFQHDDECGVLVMDETGAVGLDLSFVSWVFLMEPLEDRSLETQVVARAHRMGASQAVHVETLVMQDTAEEEIISMGQQGRHVAPDAHDTGQSLLSASSQHSNQPKAGQATPSHTSAAQQAKHSEAERRRLRNRLLCSLKHVSVDTLPQFQDLPTEAEAATAAAIEASSADILALTLPHPSVPHSLSPSTTWSPIKPSTSEYNSMHATVSEPVGGSEMAAAACIPSAEAHITGMGKADSAASVAEHGSTQPGAAHSQSNASVASAGTSRDHTEHGSTQPGAAHSQSNASVASASTSRDYTGNPSVPLLPDNPLRHGQDANVLDQGSHQAHTGTQAAVQEAADHCSNSIPEGAALQMESREHTRIKRVRFAD